MTADPPRDAPLPPPSFVPGTTPSDVDAAYRQLYAFVDDLQQVLRQRDEALRAARAHERAKGEFLAGMSDDLLNPLTTIVGFAEAMLAEAREPELRDRLSRIVKAARALEGTIHQLLAVARVPD
jgi:signal transduction histidine kinase